MVNIIMNIIKLMKQCIPIHQMFKNNKNREKKIN